MPRGDAKNDLIVVCYVVVGLDDPVEFFFQPHKTKVVLHKVKFCFRWREKRTNMANSLVKLVDFK
jgi:hypothetical protein